jgi:hypothetical protein
MTSSEMRVLLVDDDREVAEYVRRELEEESLNVVVAHDSPSALRLAEKAASDIIVLDVMMPFMDGLQVRHPPRSGWLDELGRLKGGWSVGLGVARCAPHCFVQNCPTVPSASSCSRM